MLDILKNSKANRVFFYFEEISKIPHGSGNTDHIADYLMNFAKKHDLEAVRDESNNVLIRKFGTLGHEDRPTVIIQGHTDMVAVKTAESKKDLTKDGLDLYIDGDFLRAKGTTLGGDDGIAVAYALAILESDNIPHPPIEALFTSDEEIGLLGAAAFDKSLLNGRILLNIDSDDEGVFTVGCAGGVRTDSTLNVKREEYNGKSYTLKISGLLGGHSGVEIDRGRANAIKVGFKCLSKIESIRIISLDGGVADNAIPREFSISFKTCDDKCEEKILKIAEDIKTEYQKNDPDISIEIYEDTIDICPCDKESSSAIISLGCLIPYGIIAMNPHIDGLVETSVNLGIAKLDLNSLTLCASVRSSITSEKEKLVEKLRSIAEGHGAKFSTRGDYPGWAYKENSYIRDLATTLYKEKYNKDAKVITIHAGLECGLFSDSIDDLDCISFGPDNNDIHTTEEHLSISSSIRVYEYLTDLLEKI